jgi:hypothetical protein
MTEKRTNAYLEKQLKLSIERERRLNEQFEQVSAQNVQFSMQNTCLSGQIIQLTGNIDRLTAKIDDLTKTIVSLEEALVQKHKDFTVLSGKNRGLAKLLKNESEKITPDKQDSCDEPEEPAKPPEKKSPAPKERGNNGAKRKEHFNLEEERIDIWPSDPGFDKDKAIELTPAVSIRYAYFPPRFIKKIITQHNCVMGDKVYTADAPCRTPFMNSNYEASFIAGLVQLRYIYSMPVERIFKFFNESGFDLVKPTAHSLIGKASLLLDKFGSVLQKAIHTDPYIRMDETYHTIINEGKNKKNKATRKGYIWCAMADTLQLVHFFYSDGSRCGEVFEDWLDNSYRGAVHTDGLQCYKAIETGTYPHAIRISCMQHAKRKFIDVGENDRQAKAIIDQINLLYKIEHAMVPQWSDEQKLAYRNLKAPPVLDKLEEMLLELKADPLAIPSSPLSIATNYLLNEFDTIKNYLLDADYTPDNNAIERINRYISLNRRNSLFFGSHQGAKRSALLFSLACSCRLHKINTFEYFTDILNRMAYLSPAQQTYEVLREMLPDKWEKTETEYYPDA